MKDNKRHTGSILLICDSPILFNRMENALKKAGFRIHLATTLALGLGQIRTRSYDVVIVKINFYGVCRSDVIPLIKVFDPASTVLLYGSRNEINELRTAVAQGGDQFFVSSAELLSYVTELLNSRALTKKHG